jgi:hypothetical protein
MKTDLFWDSVMFFPWIGNDYYKGGIFHKKILILGEAHYCWTIKDCEGCQLGIKNGCNGMTIQVIKNQISENGQKHAIFTKLAKLFLDKESINLTEKTSFWNSVTFYNYIQTSAADKARVAPSNEMWSISEIPFYEVMEKLEPDFLLVLGSRLWENLPGQEKVDWPEGPILSDNSIMERTWYYKGKNKNTLSLTIYHPSSSRFSYDYTPIIKKVISIS